MEEQGYPIKETSCIRITRVQYYWKKWPEERAGNQSRALNVRYFFIANQVNKGNIKVKYCPTDEMIRDFMTKPLQGKMFFKFHEAIMGNRFHLPQTAMTGVCWQNMFF